MHTWLHSLDSARTMLRTRARLRLGIRWCSTPSSCCTPAKLTTSRSPSRTNPSRERAKRLSLFCAHVRECQDFGRLGVCCRRGRRNQLRISSAVALRFELQLVRLQSSYSSSGQVYHQNRYQYTHNNAAIFRLYAGASRNACPVLDPVTKLSSSRLLLLLSRSAHQCECERAGCSSLLAADVRDHVWECRRLDFRRLAKR